MGLSQNDLHYVYEQMRAFTLLACLSYCQTLVAMLPPELLDMVCAMRQFLLLPGTVPMPCYCSLNTIIRSHAITHTHGNASVSEPTCCRSSEDSVTDVLSSTLVLQR